MAPISTIADSASWSGPTVILAVSVPVGVVILHIISKQLFKSIRRRIEQKRQVPNLKWPQLDLGHEKVNYARLEDGQVEQEHTNPISNAACVTCKHIRSSLAHTPQSPLAPPAESEKSPSSSIPEADGETKHRGIIASISDGSTMELDSDVDTPTDKYQLVSNIEFQSDKGKNDIEREHAAKRNKEHKEPDDEGDGHRGIAESPFAKVHHPGLIDLVGGGTYGDDLREVSSKSLWPNDGDIRAQGMFEELRELEHGPSTKAEEDCGACVIPDVAEIPSEVMLWRLAAHRSVVTKGMIDAMLEVVCSANN